MNCLDCEKLHIYEDDGKYYCEDKVKIDQRESPPSPAFGACDFHKLKF